jgi:hypothetical protein
MLGSRDNLNDLLENLETQGLNYFLMILSPAKDKTDDIEILTSIQQKDISKILHVLAEYKKKSENEDKKDAK